MFTKLNRVLLASGLAVASAALLIPAAFAAPTASVPNTVAVDLPVDVTLSWTGVPTVPPTIASSPTASITNSPLGTVSATGNVAYKIQASSASDGTLNSSVNPTTEKIPYTISLATGATNHAPLTVPVASLFTSTLTAPLSQPLTFSTTQTDTTAFVPATFSDTLTLTVSAQP